MTILGYLVFFGVIAWAMLKHRRQAKARREKREAQRELPIDASLGAESIIGGSLTKSNQL